MHHQVLPPDPTPHQPTPLKPDGRRKVKKTRNRVSKNSMPSWDSDFGLLLPNCVMPPVTPSASLLYMWAYVRYYCSPSSSNWHACRSSPRIDVELMRMCWWWWWQRPKAAGAAIKTRTHLRLHNPENADSYQQEELFTQYTDLLGWTHYNPYSHTSQTGRHWLKTDFTFVGGKVMSQPQQFQVTGNNFHLLVAVCYVTIRMRLLNCSAKTHSANIK